MVLDNDETVGILTARDIQLAVAQTTDLCTIADCKASDYMTPKSKLAICYKSDTLEYVAHIMREKNIRHMPVFKNDLSVGMLSIKDVVHEVLEKEKKERLDILKIVNFSYLAQRWQSQFT